MRHYARIVLGVLTAVFTVALAGCSGTVSEPQPGNAALSLRLVSPAAIRASDALTPVPDTLVMIAATAKK